MASVNYWDRVAVEFDRLYDPRHRLRYSLNRILRRGLYQRTEIACKVISALGAPSVLDVGCGSGRNILSFLDAGAARVTGIDSSVGMLRLAQAVAAEQIALGRVELIHSDFQNGVAVQPHDVVTALGVFDYLHAEALEFLRKMRSLARDVAICSAPSPSPLRAPLRALRYRFIKGIIVHFYSRQELERLCQLAGFVRHEIRPARSSGHMLIGWCR